jgi:hypothetical protein
MATPEEIAFQPEQTPDLRLISGGLAVEQSVEITPDVSAMTMEDFKVYIHGLSQSGEDAGAVLNSLIEVDGSLITHEHQVSHSMASLTVQVSILSQELNATIEKRRWASGYIKDRR